MRRLVLVFACALIVGAMAPGAALAAKPIREPLPTPPTFTITGSCSFDVQVDVTRNKEFITAFASGKTIITGQLFFRLTNLSDPSKSIELNISGPGINTADDPAFHLSGTSLIWWPGAPILLTRGPIALTTDEEGNVTLEQTSKSNLNICRLLS